MHFFCAQTNFDSRFKLAVSLRPEVGSQCAWRACNSHLLCLKRRQKGDVHVNINVPMETYAKELCISIDTADSLPKKVPSSKETSFGTHTVNRKGNSRKTDNGRKAKECLLVKPLVKIANREDGQ